MHGRDSNRGVQQQRAGGDVALIHSAVGGPRPTIAFVMRRLPAGDRYGERPSENATWGKSGRQWGEMMAVVGENRGRRRPSAVSQAVLMVQWLWSLSRLCVAVTNRHSDQAADRPLRMKRSMCRLYLIWPNTGSIVIFRWA